MVSSVLGLCLKLHPDVILSNILKAIFSSSRFCSLIFCFVMMHSVIPLALRFDIIDAFCFLVQKKQSKST